MQCWLPLKYKPGFQMGTEERGNALAEWTLYNPSVVEHVNEFTQQLQSNTGKQRMRGNPTPGQTGTDGLKGPTVAQSCSGPQKVLGHQEPCI